jgi:hypothetical protein
MINMEHPAELNRVTLEFLQELDGGLPVARSV